MDISRIVKIGCAKEGITLSVLAERLQITKQNLSNKMARNDFKFSDIEKIFAALNLEIKIFDKEGKEL